MRDFKFEWAGDKIILLDHVLMEFKAEPDTPERAQENATAMALAKTFGGMSMPPTFADEGGRARWDEVRAHYNTKRRERLGVPPR